MMTDHDRRTAAGSEGQVSYCTIEKVILCGSATLDVALQTWRAASPAGDHAGGNGESGQLGDGIVYTSGSFGGIM